MLQKKLSNRHLHPYSWWVDSFVLMIILGALFFILLGVRPLFVPDEGRYAEIAREMATRSDYITPYLNHIKYFEKPILFYWLGLIAIKVGGLNLWSLRSINALLGLAGGLITYCTARTLYDRKTGLLAALILGTSTLYFVMVHMVSLDLPVTVFLAACLYAFLLGVQHPPGRKRYFFLLGAALFAAFAVLTKGLIGIVFPCMIIFAWMAIMHEWRLLKTLYIPSCLLVFVLIAAPWHLLVGMRNPEFFYFYFIEQHFLRYTMMDVGHYQPAWFFIPCLLMGFFPWIVFLPQTIVASLPSSWRSRQKNSNEIFLLLWIFLVFIFFSFSKSKLIPYILPIFPPLAILTGRYLATAKNYISIKISFFSLAFFALGLVSACSIFINSSALSDANTTKLFLYPAAIILAIGAITSCCYAFRHLTKALIITFSTTGLFLLILLASSPMIDNRSILPLASIVKPLIKPQDEVVTFNQYYQDLPFYLERRVSILNWRNELTFGMQHQDTSAWMINDATFWQRWHSKQRVFVVLDNTEFKHLSARYPKDNFYVLGQTMKNTLISNEI